MREMQAQQQGLANRLQRKTEQNRKKACERLGDKITLSSREKRSAGDLFLSVRVRRERMGFGMAMASLSHRRFMFEAKAVATRFSFRSPVSGHSLALKSPGSHGALASPSPRFRSPSDPSFRPSTASISERRSSSSCASRSFSILPFIRLSSTMIAPSRLEGETLRKGDQKAWKKREESG